MKLSTAATFTLAIAALVGSIIAVVTPAKTQVAPEDVQFDCWKSKSGRPNCPDDYHQVEVKDGHKKYSPDKGASYYMVKCHLFGIIYNAYPDGWHQTDKKYSNILNADSFKYCARD
jgi:hypothetical protein